MSDSSKHNEVGVSSVHKLLGDFCTAALTHLSTGSFVFLPGPWDTSVKGRGW